MNLIPNTSTGTDNGMAFVSFADGTSGMAPVPTESYSEADRQRGQRFRDTRKIAELSLFEAARLFDIKASDISAIERGALRFESDDAESAAIFKMLAAKALRKNIGC